MAIKINHEKCCWAAKKCKSCDCSDSCVCCVDVCPVNAIVREDLIKIKMEECIDCGACIATCKYGALSFE